MEFKFALGTQVKEKITGFTGTVMARTEYYTGCLTYGVLNNKLDKDGRISEWEWIDEIRLEVTGELLVSWPLKTVKELKKTFQDLSEKLNEPGGCEQTPPEE
jgi:RNase P/RNase MRP subunit p29